MLSEIDAFRNDLIRLNLKGEYLPAGAGRPDRHRGRTGEVTTGGERISGAGP